MNRRVNVERSTSTAHRLLYYDGVCGNVHGHNFDWELEVHVEAEVDDGNMPVDMKTISEEIDKTDHAILLNEKDPLLDSESNNVVDGGEVRGTDWTHYEGGDLGEVITFDGDPTCEVVAQWMADRLVEEYDPVLSVTVELAETDKYTIQTAAVTDERKANIL